MKQGLRLAARSCLSLSLVALAVAAGSAFAQPPQGPPPGGFPQGGPGRGGAPEAAGPLPLVSPIFGDHMVLQRGKLNTIWGWAQPGDAVRVELEGNSASATAGADGKWKAQIQPPAAGGPYTLKISSPAQTVGLKDLLVGDVWICAGQSNMQFALRQAKNGADEVQNANFPQMRYYSVGERESYKPVEVPRGSWAEVTPATAGRIPAVAFFFAKKERRPPSTFPSASFRRRWGSSGRNLRQSGGLAPFEDFDTTWRFLNTSANRAAASIPTTSCPGTTNTISA